MRMRHTDGQTEGQNSVEKPKTCWVMSHTQDIVHGNLETLYQLFEFV